MKSLLRMLVLAPLVAILAACQTPNVPLKQDFWKDHQQKVRVARGKRIRADEYRVGQQGLLDMAINSAVSNKFVNYLHRYDLSNFDALDITYTQRLQSRGINAKRFATRVDRRHLDRWPERQKTKETAEKDYTVYARQIGPNKLLVLQLDTVGAMRNYYGFIPLGAPSAMCNATGTLVDLKNNNVLWRHHVKEKVDVDGHWDQPPNYPNFTRALDTAIAQCKSELLEDFFAS